MRIKNELNNNTCVAVKGGQAITIPAGAILELDDNIYLGVKDKLAPSVKAKELTILKDVELSEEQVAANQVKKIAAAKAFLASVEKEGK